MIMELLDRGTPADTLAQALKPGSVLVSKNGFRYRVEAIELGAEVLVTFRQIGRRRAELWRVEMERLAGRMEVEA